MDLLLLRWSVLVALGLFFLAARAMVRETHRRIDALPLHAFRTELTATRWRVLRHERALRTLLRARSGARCLGTRRPDAEARVAAEARAVAIRGAAVARSPGPTTAGGPGGASSRCAPSPREEGGNPDLVRDQVFRDLVHRGAALGHMVYESDPRSPWSPLRIDCACHGPHLAFFVVRWGRS